MTRAELRQRLDARRGELTQEVLTRVNAISDPEDVADPGYAEGLRAAVSDALQYGLAGIERRAERPAAVPISLLAQARLAARNGVGLATVLRRYSAGHAVLNAHLIEAIAASPPLEVELVDVLGSQALHFDRLVSAVAAEHGRECAVPPSTREQRRAELVRRLLDGELTSARELAYELDAFHLGAVASGQGAEAALHLLARTVDCLLLAVPQPDGTVWGWLSGGRLGDRERLAALLAQQSPAGASLAVGEVASGLSGWRLTHRQARAALPFAARERGLLVRYANVALLAAVRRDELLATSLRQLYLEPLEGERDGGQAARETLTAYFAAGRNVSSAAAALRVTRRTIANRLHAIEASLGCSIIGSAPEIEAALRLHQLDTQNRAQDRRRSPA